MLSFSVPKNNNQKRYATSKRQSKRQSLMMVPSLQKVHEVTSGTITSVAGAIASGFKTITPTDLILAARLTGYRAVADEIRIDRVTYILTPILGKSSTGRTVVYLERDSSAAAVATVPLAMDQREKVITTISQVATLSWRPQEPDDRQFNLLNPGTVSLGTFYVVSDNITDVTGAAFAGPCYTVTTVVDATLRGRPS